MDGRDDKGRFTKGHAKTGGRLSRPVEEQYYNLLMSGCSVNDWKAIIAKAIEQAKRGDAVARKWLADYLIGEPEKNVNLDALIVWEDGEN